MTLPPIADSTVPGAVTTVPVTFPALTGSHFVVTFTGVRPEYAANYYSAGPLALPLGIAEIGIPGVQRQPDAGHAPRHLRVQPALRSTASRSTSPSSGPTQHALDGGEAQLVPCGPDAKGITLGAGPHVVQTAAGHNPPCASTPTTCTGWNIDQLVLDSAAGGAAGPAAIPTAAGTPQLPATQPGPAPTVTATSVHIDSHGADVTGATEPFELVLGQSVNKGWQAVATPGPGAPPGSHRVDLGPSQLVDGFANGWQVTAADLHALGGPSFTVELTWTPQREVWAALAVSAATLLLCLLLGFLPRAPGAGCAPTCPAACAARPGPSRPSGRPCPSTPRVLALPGAPAPKDAAPAGLAPLPAGAAHRRRLRRRRPAGHARRWPGVVVAAAGRARPPGPVDPRRRQRGGRSPASSPAASTWCRARTCTTTCPGSNWAGAFVHAGNLIWLGVVLLLADAVISGLGLRVPKPLRRRSSGAPESRAQCDAAPGQPPTIVGIDG